MENTVTQVFNLLFHMSLVATFLFLFLLVTRLLVKYPVSASWRYGELKVVLLLFLLPFTSIVAIFSRVFPDILVPFSTFLLFYSKLKVSGSDFLESPESQVNSGSQMTETIPSITENLPQLQTEVAEIAGFPLDLWDILVDFIPYGFFILLFFLSCRHFMAYQRWKALQAVAKPIDPNIEKIFHEVQKKREYGKKIELLSWDLYDTPLLTGILKPKLFLTKKECSLIQYEQIFAHEVTHLKNNDHWWNFFLQLALLLHFYNPFVYLFGKKFREEMEFACDEKVVKSLDLQEKKEYFRTLLESASLDGICENSFGLGFSTTKKQLETRMKKMLDIKNMKTSTKVISSLLLGGMLLGATTPTMMEKSQNNLLEAEITSVLLESAFISSVTVDIETDERIYVAIDQNDYNHMTNTQIQECFDIIGDIAQVREGYIEIFGSNQSAKSMKADMKEWVQTTTTVLEYYQKDFTDAEWDYLMKKVEKGEIEFVTQTPEEIAYIDFLRTLDKIPSISSFEEEAAPFADPMNGCSFEERMAIFSYCVTFSNDGNLFATWSEGSEKYPIISCYHKETGELMVTEDKGVTWEAKDHFYRGTSRLEEDNKLGNTP